MSDENAEKAIIDVSHALEMWFGSQLAGWPDNPTKYFGTPAREAVMAGRASRDAEVERLQAEVKSLRANWENECGNLEMAEREVESLRQQLADAAEYLAGVKEADDSELQYRDEVEIPALRQQLAKEHENGLILAKDAHEDRMTAAALRQQLAELHDLVESIDDQRERAEQQLAERDAVIERVRAWLDNVTPAPAGWDVLDTILAAAPPSTLDALIRQKQADALEEFKSVVRGEGEPRHGGEWVSVNHVEDLLDERAAEYRKGAGDAE